MRNLSLVTSVAMLLCGLSFACGAVGVVAAEQAAADKPVTTTESIAETKLGKYLTSAQASAMVSQDANVVLIDARPRPAYFYLGHPATALSIPARFWTGKFDAQSNTFQFNRNMSFAADVATRVPAKDTPIIILSTSGKIGVIAVNLLADGGYTNVYNVVDGFNGWQKSGLPLTRKIDAQMLFIRE